MKSPYLQQHEDQPVQWYEWGDTALEEAKQKDLPILLSIGYSTCHWCHVMARESFEDEAIAEYMNAHFINIKVDREERPDLDQLYMEACQLLTGKAGWPLNIFLTPIGKPFFAGTYFPPEPGFRQQSWFQALQYAAYNYYENRGAVERQADRIMDKLQRKSQCPLKGELETPEFQEEVAVSSIFSKLQANFDEEERGFGKGAKYPNLTGLELLLYLAFYTKNEVALTHLEQTVARMLTGGIYDHLGGGMARYTVDREWKIPHFEKMLYDNAQLVSLLSDLYRWKKEPTYAKAIQKTLDFVAKELTAEAGGFYAALDADVGGQEGAYYTWSKEEIDQALGDDAPWFCAFYSIIEKGNWEGRNILYQSENAVAFAKSKGWEPAQFYKKLEKAHAALLEKRQQRPKPHRDEKIILSWNALQITAYAKAFMALGTESYKITAEKALHFLLANLTNLQGEFHRIFYQNEPAQTGFLQDYAFLIEALLNVYQITFKEDYLQKAKTYTELVLQQFYSEDTGFFHFKPKAATDLVLNPMDVQDAEVPAGNAVMLSNLQKLALLLDKKDYSQLAKKSLSLQLNQILQQPLIYARTVSTLLADIHGYSEIAILGEKAFAKADAVNQHFWGFNLLMASTDANDQFPLLAHRWQPDQTLIYWCENYACQRPVESVEALLEMTKN